MTPSQSAMAVSRPSRPAPALEASTLRDVGAVHLLGAGQPGEIQFQGRADLLPPRHCQFLLGAGVRGEVEGLADDRVGQAGNAAQGCELQERSCGIILDPG